MTPLSPKFDQLQIPEFGAAFNALNRALIVAEEKPAWEPAIAEMSAFLDLLDRKVISDQTLIAENQSDSSRAFSMLLTLIATGTQYRLEQYKPKDEAGQKRRDLIHQDYIPATGKLRQKAITLAKRYLAAPVFDSLREAIGYEILPLLDSMDYEIDPSRWMPFRVVQIGNIYERLYSFRLRTQEPHLVGDHQALGLLRSIYDRKYLRFGTSVKSAPAGARTSPSGEPGRWFRPSATT